MAVTIGGRLKWHKKGSAKYMQKIKLAYQNWIAEQGLPPKPFWEVSNPFNGGSRSTSKTDNEVQRAVNCLDEDEMELIVRFYFMGQSLSEISEKSHRQITRLESLRRRALRKLKSRLKLYVKNEYGLKVPKGKSCVLCFSPDRMRIDEIIRKKSKGSTWRPVMREICRKFGIKIKAPSLLIGHKKYH
jgi:hypothetical protein